ncbi:hypothetical protein [Helicobacter turcicus]|uniref:Uncharacterized protein n=1 Tax=Helicobacter turcicus TaxID=2867412 RepID=A0ABS7JMQ8_9HELI|nr:hypothetical protein [Helicobacter turcicus]MBX7490665.1 hypothetical protein [Helicobacter turcicus]MBX7545427.1 hypothetical protein [Helicobacter turcicus]
MPFRVLCANFKIAFCKDLIAINNEQNMLDSTFLESLAHFAQEKAQNFA